MAATCQLLAAATGRGQAVSMTSTTNTSQPAAASGTFAIGGDLPVARLGFGTMRLPTGTFTGPVRDPEDGIAVLRRAVELGVNHIDTASFYRRGDVVANELVRRALAPYPDGLVIATKVGPMLGPDGTPALQATPGQLRGLVEDNLRELGADHLDPAAISAWCGQRRAGGQALGGHGLPPVALLGPAQAFSEVGGVEPGRERPGQPGWARAGGRGRWRSGHGTGRGRPASAASARCRPRSPGRRRSRGHRCTR